MRKSSAIRLVLVSLLTTSCIGEDPSFPTRGLEPAQLQSAIFLQKEAVLDLRLDEAPPSRRDRVTQKRFSLGEGWYIAEASGRWAVGEHSTLSVYVSDPEDLSLVVEYQVYQEYQAHQGAEVRVHVNGVMVGQARPMTDWTEQTFELQAGLLHPGVNLIEFPFQFPHDRPPQLRLGNPETMVREMIGDLTPTIGHLRDLLPAIREVFPDASIYGNTVLNLPGVDVAHLIESSDGDGAGDRPSWQWRSLGAGSLSARFRTIALVERSQPSAAVAESVGLGLDRGALSVRGSGRLFIPLDSESPRESLTFAASARAGLGRSADLELSLASDDDVRPIGADTLEGLWGRTAYADRLKARCEIRTCTFDRVLVLSRGRPGGGHASPNHYLMTASGL